MPTERRRQLRRQPRRTPTSISSSASPFPGHTGRGPRTRRGSGPHHLSIILAGRRGCGHTSFDVCSKRWRGYRDRTTGASSSSSTRPVRSKDPTRFQSRCSPGCASSSPATPCRTATSTATATFGAPASATRESRVRRLRPPSGKRTTGSPTSIHIGRGAPRQGARCAGLTCSHGASGMLSTCTGRFVARSMASTSCELWLATPDGIAGGFAFDSFKRDFSERDKLVLDTLQPHLVQLWRNAAARQRESRSLAALTPREREILLWVARGKIEPRDRRRSLSRAGNDPQTPRQRV